MSLSCPIDERPIYTMHYSRPFQELCILSFHWKLYILLVFGFFSWQQLDCFDPIKHQTPFCSVLHITWWPQAPVPLCAPWWVTPTLLLHQWWVHITWWPQAPVPLCATWWVTPTLLLHQWWVHITWWPQAPVPLCSPWWVHAPSHSCYISGECTSHDGLKHQFPCVPPGEWRPHSCYISGECTSWSYCIYIDGRAVPKIFLGRARPFSIIIHALNIMVLHACEVCLCWPHGQTNSGCNKEVACLHILYGLITESGWQPQETVHGFTDQAFLMWCELSLIDVVTTFCWDKPLKQIAQ